MQLLLQPTKRDLRKLAARRNRIHQFHPDNPKLPRSVEHDYIGLLGERAFALRFGLKIDLTDRPRGDNGIDFRTEAGTVDVKTYIKPLNLIIQEGKPCADILVLAQYFPEYEEVIFLGWEYGYVMLLQPVRDFGKGIINHYRLAKLLRPIEELEELLMNKA